MKTPTVTPAPRRPRRRRRSASPPVAKPPVLVAAAVRIERGTRAVALTFDRAVNAAGAVPGAVRVTDGPGAATYVGQAVPTAAGTGVLVSMRNGGPFAGAGVTLVVAAGNGIAAADGGAAWAGATALALPFG